MSSGECPSNWIVCPPCDGVADAAGDPPYSYDTVDTAPWYDRESEPTHRFLGVHALSIEGLNDSTREATVREGITDGGTVSRVRHAVRQVRARVLLSALGEDALEAGLGWLKAALDPDFCGTHGNSCGAVDSCFFTACPPTKASITTKTPVWGEPDTNLVTNPSFETPAGAPSVLATNLHTNPSFETPGGIVVAATNLAPNPSFEALAAPVVLHTNLATNPSFETLGAPVEVRRNIVINPRCLTTAWWTTGGGFPGPLTATPQGFQMDAPAGFSGPYMLHPGDWVPTVPNASYVGSFEVTVPAGFPAVTLYATIQTADTGGANGSDVTIQPNQTVRVGSDVGFAGPSGQNRIILNSRSMPAGARIFVRNVIFEQSTAKTTDYFDGSTLNAGDWSYAWTGTTDASTSIQTALTIPNSAPGFQAKSIRSVAWAASRAASLRTIPTEQTNWSVSYPGLNAGMTFGMQAGRTYTAMVKLRLAAPLAGALHAESRSLVLVTGGASVQSAPAPNVAGVHEIRLTFSLGAGTTDAYLYFCNGASAGNGDAWWDDFMIVEGAYSGGYFDGSTPVKITRNLILNPRAVAGGAPWIGPGGQPVPSTVHPAGNTTYETTGGGEVATYARQTGTPSSTVGTTALTFASGIPSLPSQAYSGSVMVRSSVAATVQVAFWARDSGHPETGVADIVTLVPNVWTKVPFTNLVSKSNAFNGLDLTLVTPSGVLVGNGQTLDVGHAIVVLGPTDPAYFDASMPGGGWEGTPNASISYSYDPSFTYAWTGTPDASTSTQSAAIPVGVTPGGYGTQVFGTTAWASDRSHSLAIVASGLSGGPPATDNFASVGGDQGGLRLGILPGKTYTLRATIRLTAPVSGADTRARRIVVFNGAPSTGGYVETMSNQAPNMAGVYPLSVTFTTAADANDVFVRLYNGGGTSGDTVWYDEFMLVEGVYNGSYFDGATPDGSGNTYDWTGVADASTSTLSAYGVAGVPGQTPLPVQTQNSPVAGTKALRFTLSTTGTINLGITDAALVNDTVYTMLGKVRPANRAQTFTPQLRGRPGTPFTAQPGVWTEFRYTGPSGGSGDPASTGLLLVGGSGHQAGDIVDFDTVAFIQGAYVGPYFDGSTPDGSFTYDWTGAVDASTSTLSAVDVADATPPAPGTVVRWQDSESPVSGTKIARFQVAGTGDLYFPIAAYGHTTGDTYTVVGKVRPKNRDTTFQVAIRGTKGPSFVAPMGVWTEFRAEIIAGNGAADATGLFAATGATQAGDVIDVDTVLMVLGSYLNQYFDGDTPDDPTEIDETLPVGALLYRYAWTGTPHASTSIREEGRIASAPDPVVWGDTVDSLLRTMHDVTCISGPLIEQKLHRDDMWGYIVEFTLAAGTPWLFGMTKSIVIPPSLPVVVQDVPYNLVPYPSAELASGTVVVAKNFASNPSVETDATGWVASGDGGNIPNAQLVGARSTELAAAGGASFKVTFTAAATAVGGAFVASQTVALPGITPTTRYSVNLWAVASVQSGTAVLGNIEYRVQWKDSGGTTLRDDLLGTLAAAGGAVSGKSLLPPAGTTQATVRALLRLTSWSSGAIVRLYADALAVTVP
jgi:hypothetical protein